MNDLEFRRHARRLLVAWLALLVLMAASLGSSYLSLGIGNALVGLGIAAVKSTIVIAFFMGLARGPALLRLVAAAALGTWLLLLALSSVDYATRPAEPAVYQVPQQAPLQPR